MVKIPNVVDDFKKMGGQAAGAISGVVGDINQFIDHINEALVTLRSLGLSIELMSMRVVPPEAEIHLTGGLEAIDEAKAKELINGKENNPILNLILQAFRALALLKKPLSEAGFKGVKLNITAGIIPKIDFVFLK